MDYPAKTLNYYEELIFNHWTNFLDEFSPEASDLVRVRFSSSGVEFVVIMMDGESVVDGTTLDKFLAWVEVVK